MVLKVLKMAKEIEGIGKKEGLKHPQEIITKVDAKIDFKNKETKAFRNKRHNVYEELKGMEEVLHQWEEELSIQLAVVENVHEGQYKDWNFQWQRKRNYGRKWAAQGSMF